MPNTIASTDVGGTGLSTVGTNGQVLTSNGTTLSWQTPAASTTFSAGTTGFTPNTATSGNVTLAGTLNIANGGTGLTSFTAGQIHYGSFSQSANLFWDNTNARLGIGTSSPTVPLDVRGNGYFISSSSPTSFWSVDSALTTGSGYCQWNTSVTSFISGSYTSHPYYFVTGNTERMRITSGGQVLIGTSTSPTTANQIPLLVSTGGSPAINFYSNGTASQAATCGISTSTYGASKWAGYMLSGNGNGVYTNSSASQATYIVGFGGSGSIQFGNLNNNPFENTSSTFTQTAQLDASGNLTMNSGNILNSSGRPMVKQTGGVLQVQQAVLPSLFTTSSTTMVDVTSLTLTITPSSSSSKFYIQVTLFGFPNTYTGFANIVRVVGGTPTNLLQATPAGVRPITSIAFSQDPSGNGPTNTLTQSVLDSPATASAITYKVQASGRPDGQAGQFLNIGASATDRNTNSYDPRGSSSITVWEIAG